MRKNYYIGLLPKLDIEFYELVNRFYVMNLFPEVKLPFHVTVFYFGAMNDQQKMRVFDWFDKYKPQAMKADVEGVNSFGNENPFVVILKLKSSKIVNLHKSLQIFSDIHQDDFEFVPHVSLFHPKKKLLKVDMKKLKKNFSGIKKLDFKAIYLASVEDRATNIERIIYL